MEIELTLTHMNTGDIPRFRALVRRQSPYSSILLLYDLNKELQW
jgi:hypothetical protein